MDGRYIVHRIFNGEDKVIGSFVVKNNEIYFDNEADELNCDMFPPGPIHPATARRLKNLLNNEHKSVYLVRG